MNVHSVKLFNYCKLLHEHDWSYEYSDDNSVWRQGSIERMKLLELQKEVDPEWKVWDAFAPTDYRRLKLPAIPKENANGN